MTQDSINTRLHTVYHEVSDPRISYLQKMYGMNMYDTARIIMSSNKKEVRMIASSVSCGALASLDPVRP